MRASVVPWGRVIVDSYKQALAAVCVVGCGLVQNSLSWADASVVVSKVQLRATTATTRLVLELSTATKYSIFVLEHPDRLVSDIPAARLENAQALPTEQGMVKRLRAAMRDRGTLRIVADLSQPALARNYSVPADGEQRPQIVVELTDATASR